MPAVIYKRERDLLQFISQYMQKNGFAPTLAEICDGLGLRSPATVHEHIANLIDKGVLKKDEGVRRGLEIVDRQKEMFRPTGPRKQYGRSGNFRWRFRHLRRNQRGQQR